MAPFMIAMLGAGPNTIHGAEKIDMERWLELTLQDDDKIWINMRQIVSMEPRGPTDNRLVGTNGVTYRVKETPAELAEPYDDE